MLKMFHDLVSFSSIILKTMLICSLFQYFYFHYSIIIFVIETYSRSHNIIPMLFSCSKFSVQYVFDIHKCYWVWVWHMYRVLKETAYENKMQNVLKLSFFSIPVCLLTLWSMLIWSTVVFVWLFQCVRVSCFLDLHWSILSQCIIPCSYSMLC